ncbi:MAG TPA: hypothetical protein VER98_09465, partial [Terriglobia bacterium]|nr:hypothetical protein [Terriglobia bacterium]
FVREDGLAMSDIPWAMAWYGNVPTVSTTQGSEGFIEIDSLEKPIKEIYLSSVTLNRGLSQWIRNRDGWGFLLLQSLGEINQRQALQGYVRWPAKVNFVIERGSGGTVPLTLHYLQSGWPDEFLVTAREKPVTPIESK